MIFQVSRQLEFIVGRKNLGPNTDSLEEAMAILQHHDGVTGTEKQHVADDYSKRLADSSSEVKPQNLSSVCVSKRFFYALHINEFFGRQMMSLMQHFLNSFLGSLHLIFIMGI